MNKLKNDFMKVTKSKRDELLKTGKFRLFRAP